ncbi:hypothetical protein [Sphingobium sp. CFD-2]|uniref:hypothetical protein n=1 Tax=Sphingobium sp. CFD-2 TaxID=2878542 RepID=UPI00214BC246|nr:hypothetical protein [Sphingobium sp. CFD-2]
MPDVDHMYEAQGGGDAPNIGDFVWRPRYAKLWWAAVPIYWLGMAGSLRFSFLAQFYDSALAGFLTVFFFPPLVSLILGFGFLRKWLEAIPQSGEQSQAFDDSCFMSDRFGPSGMPCEFDPLDARSGALWVGNTLNPLNAGYINRAS